MHRTNPAFPAAGRAFNIIGLCEKRLRPLRPMIHSTSWQRKSWRWLLIPHRYDHDEVHGDSLIEQQRLAAALVGAPAPRTSDDISAVFEEQRSTAKANMLRDVGNQNPWRDAPMQAADAKKIAEETWLLNPDVDQHYGARTIPSKPIAKVDRSERIGEDTTLTDRVHAAASQAGMDEASAKIFEDLDFKQRQRRRQKMKDAMKDVKELVDDDLEF